MKQRVRNRTLELDFADFRANDTRLRIYRIGRLRLTSSNRG